VRDGRGQRRELQAEREWEHNAGPLTAQDALEGGWTRSQLGRMDADFACRLERAFATGQEQRASAQAVVTPPSGERSRASGQQQSRS
jgi:hypothetical protein